MPKIDPTIEINLAYVYYIGEDDTEKINIGHLDITIKNNKSLNKIGYLKILSVFLLSFSACEPPVSQIVFASTDSNSQYFLDSQGEFHTIYVDSEIKTDWTPQFIHEPYPLNTSLEELLKKEDILDYVNDLKNSDIPDNEMDDFDYIDSIELPNQVEGETTYTSITDWFEYGPDYIEGTDLPPEYRN